MPPPQPTTQIKIIRGVRLPGNPLPESIVDITISYSTESPQGTITSITPHETCMQDRDGDRDILQLPLLLPPLTHPHIHLDKAYIHSDPKYAHLRPSTGSFQEALSSTTQAKAQFTRADLRKRGEWLLAESVAAGVTAMRAFVEVDHTVKLACLETGLQLKDEWKDSCEMQIVCFAQDPIFSGPYAEENRALMEDAIRTHPGVDVIGTTPYVESGVEAAKSNIDWAIETALEHDKHVDFHLDYNLDRDSEPLVWHVLRKVGQMSWTTRSSSRRVMVAHCSRLTLFTDEEWERLVQEIRHNDLPISFVGLPTSDLYMASPPPGARKDCGPQERERGTLHIPEMIHRHGLDACLGVNNVGNAFTPWGSADPLSLACLGVGIYQTGTQADAELLYECVSTRARAAIGLSSMNRSTGSSLDLKEGDRPDFLLLYNVDETGFQVPRARGGVAEVVWDPPATLARGIVTRGRFVVKPMTQERAASSPGTTIILHERE